MKVYLTVSLKAGRKYNESKKKAQVNTVIYIFSAKETGGVEIERENNKKREARAG